MRCSPARWGRAPVPLCPPCPCGAPRPLCGLLTPFPPSESYVIHWASTGVPRDIELLNNLRAIFTVSPCPRPPALGLCLGDGAHPPHLAALQHPLDAAPGMHWGAVRAGIPKPARSASPPCIPLPVLPLCTLSPAPLRPTPCPPPAPCPPSPRSQARPGFGCLQ